MSKDKKNYLCCITEPDSPTAELSNCTVDNANWAFSGRSRPFEYISAPHMDRAWTCGNSQSSCSQVRDFEKFEWRPSSCRIDRFEAGRFCSMLGHRRLVIVGDSTASQAAASLMNMIIAGSADGRGCASNISNRLTDCMTSGVCKDRGADAEWRAQKFLGHASAVFSDAIMSATESDILVLSAGPHIHTYDDYQQLLDHVALRIKQKREQKNAPMYLWKTVSGAGCGTVGTTNLHSGLALEYGWNNFPKYDDMAGSIMSSIGVPVVNVSMLHQRGDAHPGRFNEQNPKRDCLHFCIPGPLDDWPKILSHVLRGALA